jgi:hypothetical protein
MALTRNSFDNPDYFLRTLGTWWATFFGDRTTVREMLAGAGELYYQTYLDFLDTLAMKSKFTVPIFRRKNWHAFTVLASERFDGSQLNNLYGTSRLEYRNILKPAYGDKEDTDYFSYRIPDQIASVHAIYNRLIDPSLVWAENEDFGVDAARHAIHFATDPFTDPLVPQREVLDSEGNVVDHEILLWFNLSQWDHEFIYNYFGYAVKIWMKSSNFYKEFVSAVWDHLTIGPTKAALKLALMGMTGVRFALANETITRVINDGRWIHIETPTQLYTFKNNVTVLVEAGDSVVAGDPLVDAVLVIEPSPVTDWDTFTGVALNGAMMRMGDVKYPITFENKDVPVEYIGLDPNGKAIVQFSVSGFDSDVATFWRQAHNEGLALDQTLAEVLDTRTNPIGEPLPQDMPEFINPFEFVIDNLFSNNLFVIVMKPEQFADGAPGLQGLEYLYKFLVPQSTYLIFVEMEQDTDYYSIGNSEDTVSFQKAVPPIYEAVESLALDHGPTIKPIKENCR